MRTLHDGDSAARPATRRTWLRGCGVAAVAFVTSSALLLGSAAFAAEPIVLGQSLPQQAADRDGRATVVLAGATSYVEAVNARGGVGGRPLKLVTLNDDNDPQRHAQNLRRLASEHKAVAFLNCVGDAMCAVAANVAAELQVPLVGVFSGTRTLTHAQNAFVYRIRVGYDRETEALARQIKALAITRLAIVTDAPEGAEQVQSLRAAMTRYGIESAIVQVPQATPAAIEVALTQLGQGRFEAAALDLQPATVNLLVDKGYDRHEHWPITLTSLAGGTLNLLMGNFRHRLIGYSAVVPNPERANSMLVQEMQRAAERVGGPEVTNPVGFESFINTKICVEGLRRTGGRADAAALAKALDAMTDVDIGGYRISFARSRPSGLDFVDVGVRPRAATR